MKGNEWIADAWIDYAKAIKAADPKVYLINGVTTFDLFREFTDILIERGAVGPDGDKWIGGTTGNDREDMNIIIDYYGNHNLFFCCGILNNIFEVGPVSAIDEAYKNLCEHTKKYPRFTPSTGTAAAHWTPFEHVDAATAAMKKYSKY